MQKCKEKFILHLKSSIKPKEKTQKQSTIKVLKMKYLLIIIFISFAFLAYGQVKKQKNITEIKEETFYYNLNIVNSNEQLEFHINLRYKSDSIHKVLLPFDYYGTPDLHQWVKLFEVDSGTKILEEGSNFRKVSPNEKGEVHIKYQIQFNPLELDKYSYAPNVSSSFFYMAGCQWMLPIHPLEKKANYNITMNGKDSDWVFYSSLSEDGNNIFLESSYEDLISAGFGGNSHTNSQVNFELQGTTYSVFINGDFHFDKEILFTQLKKTLGAEKLFFSDDEKSFYNITILPRTGLLAGASIPNLFYCFVDTNQSAENIQELIAHEYFHNWLPNKMYIPTLKGEYDFKHEWFHEGFTEYFSRKILYEKGIISKDYYVELLNTDLINIANNPSANESYNEIASRENYSSAQKKLSYYRGVLIALCWDYLLSKKGSSLKEMMLHLYTISKKSDGKISYEDIYNFGNKFSLNFKTDFEKYIIQGKTFELEKEAIEGYHLFNQTIKLFDPGFDVQKSAKEKIIQGVDPYGAAYQAGLRNGMTYMKRKNSNRWSNSWSENKPYIVTVFDNGQEKEIAFFPLGDLIETRLYQKNKLN